MWWVIIIIFFCGLLLSTGTFLLQYFGYCPTTPALPGSWPVHYNARGLQMPKEEGLPADVVNRLRSYNTINDVPFKLVPLDSNEEASKGEEEAECLVCQEEMRKEHVSQLVCGHIFHKSCISSWLQRKASCPVCRQAITKESVDGTPCHATCIPDVEMAVMKRANDTETSFVGSTPTPSNEKANAAPAQECNVDYEQPSSLHRPPEAA